MGGLLPHDTCVKLIITGCVFLTLTAVAVSLRLYVRRFMLKSVQLDDWLLLATFVVFVAVAAIQLMVGVTGDQSVSLVAALERSGKLYIAGVTLYHVCTILLKVSLAVFFVRIVVRPWQRLFITLSVTIFVLFDTAYTIVYLFRCGVPTWEGVFLPQPNCVVNKTTLNALNQTSAVLNCLTDWIMACCPLFVISQLKLNASAKASVLALTALGLLGSVVSIVRIPLVKVVANTGSPGYTEGLATVTICSIVELAVGILAFSLAALRPLLKKFVDNVFTSQGTGNETYGIEEMASTARQPKSMWSLKPKTKLTVNTNGDKMDMAEIGITPITPDGRFDPEKGSAQSRIS